MIAFHGQNNRVLSLSQAEGFYIHDFLASKGIETYSHVIRSGNSVWYYLRHILHFISFCRKNKIEIVYSHLEPANFVAAIAQFFIPGKIYICRHHIDEASLYNFQYSIFYRITYALAKKIIVVSDHAKRFMITREGIRPEKIIHIDLAYDFDFFPTPSEAEIGAIRARHKDSIILLTACRLTKFKRPDLSVLVLRRLIDSGSAFT